MKKGGKYSALMLKALNYMLNGWNELLNYRKDGRYTIDNLPAERAIRSVTVARKKSLHYSSEEGLQVALTYMTVIETVKMLGMDLRTSWFEHGVKLFMETMIWNHCFNRFWFAVKS